MYVHVLRIWLHKLFSECLQNLETSIWLFSLVHLNEGFHLRIFDLNFRTNFF
uniref:Uncharacterized protein n=1 Tax=Arundo donax TaxID=35708 RepID=A0A0A9BA75_ARUDO